MGKGKLNEDISKKRDVLLKLLDHSEKKTTSHVNSLFEAKLKKEPMDMEEIRKNILSVKEKVMRRKFQSDDDLLVLNTIIAQIQYVLQKMKEIEPLLNPFDGSNKLTDLILSIQLWFTIIIESTSCKNKVQLLKVFKRHQAKTFYKLVKGDKLDHGLPQDIKKIQCEENMVTGAPNEEKDRKTPFFAWWKDDIARSAVDFFSIGHVLMGQCFFFIAYVLLWDGNGGGNYGLNPGPLWRANLRYGEISIIVAVVVGIIWEPLENILLWKLGMKFEDKRDSWLNMLFDIIFVTAGSFIAFYINGFYINLGLIVIEMILFFVLRWYFLNKR